MMSHVVAQRGRRNTRFTQDRNEDEDSRVQSVPVSLPPAVAAPDAKALIVYSTLDGQPLELVRLRVILVQMLNHRLRSTMPFVDWTAAHQPWTLAAILGRWRGVIFSALKQKLWARALRYGRTNPRRFTVRLDNLKATEAREQGICFCWVDSF